MKTITLFVCLLLSLPAIAQDTMTMPDGTIMPASAVGSQYGMSEQYFLADNQNNCQTQNCLILTNTGSGGGTVSFAQVSSGFDGSVYGIDGVGNVWMLPFSATTKALWTKVAAFGSGLKAIAVASSTEIYGTYSSSSCPTGYALKAWNGSTWTGIAGCYFTLSITSDGMLVVVASDHQLHYTLTPTNPSWRGIAAPAGATWTNVVGFNSFVAFGNVGTVLYEANLSTGALTAVAGAPAVSNTPNNMAVSPDGWLFIRSNTSTTKGNFWAYYFANQTVSWYNMVGTIAILGGNVSDALFAQNSSAYLYHYLKTALAHTSTVSGHYDCGIGCPVGSVHTATASGRFLHGTNTAASSSVSGTPASTLTANYNDVSSACDPMFGDPAGPECYISQTTTTINNQVKCSVMGMIYSAALAVPTLLQHKLANTRAIYTGVRSGCITGESGLTWCDYSVNNWCANTHFPILDMNGKLVHDQGTTAHSYWDLKAFCINPLGLGWECSRAFGPGRDGVAPQASNCDSQ